MLEWLTSKRKETFKSRHEENKVMYLEEKKRQAKSKRGFRDEWYNLFLAYGFNCEILVHNNIYCGLPKRIKY